MMPITLPKTIRRTLTFILLTAASFWLFACQARAATLPGDTSDPLVLFAVTGLALLGLAYGAQILRLRTAAQGRI